MRRPDDVYVRLSALAALAGTLAFTITNIYRFTVAGLTPFQLVVVGTAMEAAVFVSEIPTGVVADLYSRRWSVIIACGLRIFSISRSTTVCWVST